MTVAINAAYRRRPSAVQSGRLDAERQTANARGHGRRRPSLERVEVGSEAPAGDPARDEVRRFVRQRQADDDAGRRGARAGAYKGDALKRRGMGAVECEGAARSGEAFRRAHLAGRIGLA